MGSNPEDIYEQLDFKHFPAYARFLKKNKLDEFVKQQLQLSRQANLPLIKFFEHMQEDELVELSKTTTTKFLTYVEENNVARLIRDSQQQWVNNELPQVEKYNISPKDITLLSYIRKQGFLHFLPQYTADVAELVAIIKEIDKYISHSDSAAFITYKNLLDERIIEHAHFIEKITNTSPGIIYVFDLIEHKEVYSNGKTMELLGYSHEDFQRINGNFSQELEHPDDLQKAIENKAAFITAKDDEIRSFDHRLKDSGGNYRWIRNYESVFKRDEDGKPTQVIGIALDIGKEKQMADELHHREEQLLEAQELAEMGSFTWDLVNDVSEVTPQLNKMLEREGTEKLEDFMNSVHTYDQRFVKQALETAIRENGIFDCEYRYQAKKKEKILWTRGKVFYKDGKPDKMKGTITDVTDRRHMIQRLQRSEELYKQAQALTHLGNWTLDIAKNKITWTDELYRIFGMEPQSEEITFGLLFSFISPKDKDHFLETVSQLKHDKANAEYFQRILLKDGATKILSVKAEVLFNNEGVAYKMIGTVQDVTQQKQTEKKLRENQNFIQKITDATPSVIAAYNIHTGKYLFINQAFEKILGYDSAAVLEDGAKFLTGIIHPDDLKVIMEENAKALELANKKERDNNEIVAEFKYRMRHKNGSYRWFHSYGTVFDRNENKHVEHILNVSIDITDRIEAENKVLEQERLIQHIAEASPTILYLFDLETESVVYVNNEITAVLGFLPEEMIDMQSDVIKNLFHPDDFIQINALRNSYGAQNTIQQYECRLKEKNGGWKYLLVREIKFQFDEGGKATQLLCAALDITERKHMEEVLYEKTIELEQSNSGLEEFAYVASHDLKEPLRKISTFGDRLLFNEKDKLSDTSLSYLQKIIDSSHRMQRMIEDLLSISMITGERNFETYSLQDILTEVIQMLEFKIEENNATIDSDNLPRAKVIASQFRQLFQNLISNSLKFSHAGVPPRITITHEFLSAPRFPIMQLPKGDKYLQIKFSDNGIGFEEQYADKIFAIFHRLHGKTEYEGTGIGLAICKKIVENHGGIITASGERTKGSVFTITIPV